MVNEQLVQYIEAQKKRGVAVEDLQKALLAAGWSAADIATGLATAADKQFNNSPQLSVVNASVGAPKKKFKLPIKLRTALAIFTLVSAGSAVLVPFVASYFGNPEQPNILQIALTGLALILLTAPLLNFVARELGLSRAWFLLALIYNSLIIIIKFILSPMSLYGQVVTVDTFSFDPNAFVSYISVAAIVMLLYIAVFSLIYYFKRKEVFSTLGSDDSLTHGRRRASLGTTILILVALIVGGWSSGVLLMPLFFGISTLSYLSYVFAGLGIFIIISVAVAAYFAYQATDNVSNTAIEIKDASLITAFFWLGLSMILIYHAVWVVYMAVMMTIWPFKTIAPSGK